MTPKEKAMDIAMRFDKDGQTDSAKQCALICVDEILSFIPYKTYKDTLSPYDEAELSTDYWEEVKQEILKL